MLLLSEDLPVLIETLWNVKNYESEETEVPEPVLIETLWNVKLEH